MATLFEFLKFTRDPVSSLSAVILKDPQIALWVSQHIVAICSNLLTGANDHRSNQVAQFINKHTDGKNSFAAIFTFEARVGLRDLAQYAPELNHNSTAEVSMRNALLIILQNKATRSLLKLSEEEIENYLRIPVLRSLLDRLVAEDETLWNYFLVKVSSNFMRANKQFKYEYPCLSARLAVQKKIRQVNVADFYDNTLEPMAALMVTNTQDWDTLKKIVGCCRPGFSGPTSSDSKITTNL